MPKPPRVQILAVSFAFLFVFGLVLVACAANSGDPPQSPQRQESGIKGKVLRGPVTPGPQTGTEPNERPFRAVFHVHDAEGNEVGKFESNDDGEFQMILGPGEYTVVPDKTAPLMAPTGQRHLVRVPEGEMLEVTLRFNTGIR